MRYYYVYIIECLDKTLYTGITNNYHARFAEHLAGKKKNAYTYSRRPLRLPYVKEFSYIHDAISAEKRLKKWSTQKKLAFIQQDSHKMKILSRCKNKSHYNLSVIIFKCRENVYFALRGVAPRLRSG